jgi:hypothetical protein
MPNWAQKPETDHATYDARFTLSLWACYVTRTALTLLRYKDLWHVTASPVPTWRRPLEGPRATPRGGGSSRA